MRLAAFGLAALLGGCAAGGAIDYMRTEYGSAQRDAMVDISDNPEFPQQYQIWVHKTKPKINIQVSIATAASTGFAQGLTFGAVDAAPVQPTFEKAALKYLTETKGPNCRLSNPVKLASIVWEFDFSCAPPAPPPLAPKRR